MSSNPEDVELVVRDPSPPPISSTPPPIPDDVPEPDADEVPPPVPDASEPEAGAGALGVQIAPEPASVFEAAMVMSAPTSIEPPGKTLITKEPPKSPGGSIRFKPQTHAGASLRVVVKSTKEIQPGVVNFTLQIEYEEMQLARWTIVKTLQEIQLFSKQVKAQFPGAPAELAEKKKKKDANVEKVKKEVSEYFNKLFQSETAVTMIETTRFFAIAQHKYGTVRKKEIVGSSAKKRFQDAVKKVVAITPITSALKHVEDVDKAASKYVPMKIEKGCCSTTPNPEQKLGDAVRMNLPGMVDSLVKQGASIHAINANGEGLLSIAIMWGNSHLVQKLLDYGADIEQMDKSKRTPLFHAVSFPVATPLISENDQVEMVKLLLKNHASTGPLSAQPTFRIPRERVKDVLREHDERIIKPFMKESKENLAQAVLYLDTGLDPNWVLHDGKTLLVKVAEGFAEEGQQGEPLPMMMDLLIRRGAKLEAKNSNGRTALHQVVMSGNIDAVRMLIAYGADIDVKDNVGYSPLHHAVSYQAQQQRGRLATKTPEEKDLHAAIEAKKGKIVELLCNNGAEVNATTSQGNTPMHVTALISNPPLVNEKSLVYCTRILLKYQANFNAKNNSGQTPFDIAKLKVSQVAVAIKDHDRGVALLESVHRRDEKNIRALMEGDDHPNIDFEDPEGYTALHMALKMKDKSMISLLLEHKPSVSVEAKGPENTTVTPIQTARAMAGEPEGLKILQMVQEYMVNQAYLSAGTEDDTMGIDVFKIDARTTDNLGRTVLHNAAKAGSIQAVRQLLTEIDVKPSVADKKGSTPLHLAAEKGHFQVVELLLQNKPPAQVNKMDERMNTPLHLALHEAFEIDEDEKPWAETRNRAKRYLETIQALVKHEADLHKWNELLGTPVEMAQSWLAHNLQKKELEEIRRFLSYQFLIEAKCLTPEDVDRFMDDVDDNTSEGDFDEWDSDDSDDEDSTNENMNYRILGKYVHGSVIQQIATHITVTDVNKQFMEAAQCGDAVNARECLRRGASIHYRAPNGDTALHLAARNPPHTCVTLLLQQGARPGVVNNAKESPIKIAQQTNPETMAKRLEAWQLGRMTLDAAKSGNVLKMKELIEQQGAQVNFTTFSGITPLHQAVQYQRIACIEHLLSPSLNANINAQTRTGKTPLHIAIEAKLGQAVSVLLQHNPRVDIEDAAAHSVMDLVQYPEYSRFRDQVVGYEMSHKFLKAAEMGDIETISEIFGTKGFNIDFVDENDETALHKAVQHQHFEVAKFLLYNGADTTLMNNKNQTPHMMALEISVDSELQSLTWTCAQGTKLLEGCAAGRLNEVRSIVEKEVNLDFSDAGGLRALHWASLNGQVEVVQYLLQQKADAFVKDSDDMQPLHYAAMAGKSDIVKVLYDHAKSHKVSRLHDPVNVRDIHGRTPLILSTLKKRNNALKALLRIDAKPTLHDRSGHTPLILAAQDNDSTNLKALLEDVNAKKLGYDLSAVINKRDHDNQSALLVATLNCNLDSMQKLLDAGANPDLEDVNGETPLIIAARKGGMQQVLVLLNGGVKASRGNSQGWTALHAAVHGKCPEIGEVLIQRGAPVDIATTAEFKLKAGMTPLHLAVFENNLEFARLLLANRAKDQETWGGHIDAQISADFDGGDQKKQKLMSPSQLADRLGNIAISDLIKSTSGGVQILSFAEKGEVSQLRMALEAGGKVDYMDADRNTALHLACAKDPPLSDVVTLLMQFGATSSIVNKDGKTAQDLAKSETLDIIRQHEEENDLFRKIMDTIYHKRNESVTDGSLKTLLTKYPVDHMRKILDRLDLQTRKNYPIHAATYNGSDMVVELLIQCGATIDAVNAKGDTSLMIAATVGSIGCARVLMRYQADLNVRNSAHQDALAVATELGHNRVVNVLNGLDYDVEDSATKANRVEQEQLIEEQRQLIHKEFEKDIKKALNSEIQNHFGQMMNTDMDEAERTSHLDKIKDLYDTLAGHMKTWAPTVRKVKPSITEVEDLGAGTAPSEEQKQVVDPRAMEREICKLVESSKKDLQEMFYGMKDDFEKQSLKLDDFIDEMGDDMEDMKKTNKALFNIKRHMRNEQ